MMVGQKVKVSLPQLPRNHIGIRFDDSQGAAAAVSAPRGASGQVWRIWVKRVFFGQLFD